MTINQEIKDFITLKKKRITMSIKINVSILQDKDFIELTLHGKYKLYNKNGFFLRTITDNDLKISLNHYTPAKCDWYQKIETFYDSSMIEKYHIKYQYKEKKTRIVKAGRTFNNEQLNNFEYWILEKIKNKDFNLTNHIPTHIKPIIKKESLAEFSLDNEIFSNQICLKPVSEDSFFTVKNVRVGVEFHWDHTEDLNYKGGLTIKPGLSGKLLLINTLDIEDYLESVNSSEMRSDNNPEMLKAQTIAARSTVFATAGKHHYGEGFDLCNDDHCQCYQGLNRITPTSKEVTKATKGEVLLFENKVIDARYSKICGGITERFSTCWEDMDFVYLQSFPDKMLNEGENHLSFHFPLSENETRSLIINQSYDCFCNTNKYSLPSSLDFCKRNFRWQEILKVEKLEQNIKERFPEIKLGTILDIKILERGPSGRAKKMEICGKLGSLIVEKELKIRRILSDSHLKSSLIFFEKSFSDSKLTEIKIFGGGWGHGVGLCQIGAEVMGQKGFNYKEICLHYYKGCRLKKII